MVQGMMELIVLFLVIIKHVANFRGDAAFDKELWETQKRLRNSCLYMGPYYTGKGNWSAA